MHRIAAVAVFLLGCTAPAIESYCNATTDGVECSFTNMGGKGQSCVAVTLKNVQTGATTRTVAPVCSGELSKMASSNVKGAFADPQPSEVCKNESGEMDWDMCQLEVARLP